MGSPRVRYKSPTRYRLSVSVAGPSALLRAWRDRGPALEAMRTKDHRYLFNVGRACKNKLVSTSLPINTPGTAPWQHREDLAVSGSLTDRVRHSIFAPGSS